MKKIIVYCSILPKDTPPYSWYRSAKKLSESIPIIFIDQLEIKPKQSNWKSLFDGWKWFLINFKKPEQLLVWNFNFPYSHYGLFLYLWFLKAWRSYRVILITNVPSPYPIYRYIPSSSSYYECTDQYKRNEFIDCAENIKSFTKVFANTQLLFDEMKKITTRTVRISSGYAESLKPSKKRNVRFPNSIVFSGGISHRINYDLLYQLAVTMKKNQFFFLGEIYLDTYYVDPRDKACLKKWKRLLQLPNVFYLGKFSYEQSIELLPLFEWGIIPYDMTDIMNFYSHPVKTYEYLAAGLRIFTAPIPSVLEYRNEHPIYVIETPKQAKEAFHQKSIKGTRTLRASKIERILEKESVDRKVKEILLHIQ